MLAISTNYRTHQRKRVYNCPTLDWDIMSKNLQSTDIKDLSITMHQNNIIKPMETEYKADLLKQGIATVLLNQQKKLTYFLSTSKKNTKTTK
jgi:hypothetical protein